MNDPNVFGFPEGTQEPTAPTGPGYPAQYKFTPAELRVLNECNQESFFQRSMPIGTVFGLGTFAAVQKGHLKPNVRFGAMPKVSLAVIVGYFLGKLSYQQACAEKLMALPDSYIGQVLRDRKDGKATMGGQRPRQTNTMLGANPTDIYSDAGPGSSLDLDTDRPLFSEDYRSDHSPVDGPPSEAAPPRPGVSYDELRLKNRGEYSETKQDPYKISPSPPPAVGRARPADAAPRPRSTNRYGDDME